MKTIILTTSVAALLISAVGCQSTDTTTLSAANRTDVRTEENWASYPRTNPLVATNYAVTYSPPVSGNYGQQVGATAWQDTRTYAPANNSDSMARNSGTNSPDNSAISSSGETSAASLNAADQQFLINAAMGQLYEGALGQVAIKKSESAKIRDLATKIYNDSAATIADLQRVAKSKNVTLPTELDRAHRDMLSKLENTDKASFDQEFLRQQAVAHRDAISMYEAQANSGRDEAARNYAKNTLPSLQSHLQSVEAPLNTASDK